jgi:hypothetical protein
VFGQWVTRASAFLRDPLISGKGGDLDKVFRSNNKLISAFGDTLGSVSAGMLDFLVASRPFARRIGEVSEAFGDWFQN